MSTNLQAAAKAANGANSQPVDGPRPLDPLHPVLSQIARYWWVELIAGVLWTVIALVILKFNDASVVTVGVLTGVLLLLFAAEQFVLAVVDQSATRWVWGVFGVLLTAAGIVALVHPVDTFAGLADILGFVFLLLGVLWTMQAFMERAVNALWWLTLLSGILMVGLAFWISGQFFLTRAATLLVFTGIWALMKGITDIVRAFQIRGLDS